MAATDNKPPIPDDRITVVCMYCNRSQEVGRKAMSVTCKHCYKPLKLEDINIKTYIARTSVDTCGTVTVEKKGNVVATKINCGGLVVRGKIKATVVSRGTVLVGPEAEIKGDVSAPTLAVGAGAILEGHYDIGPKASEPPPPAQQ